MAVKMLLIAILIAVLMTLFSGIYPGSVLYGWLDHETKLGIPCGAPLYGSERPDLCLNVSELLELIQ